MEVFYISDSDFKNFNSTVSKNLDPTWVVSHIRDAQNEFINQLLGKTLAAELLEQIELNTLTPENEALLEVIKPAHAKYTLYKAYPFLHVRVENSGVSFNLEATQQSVDNKRLTEIRAEILHSAEFYLDQLKNFLDVNHLDYPLYPYICRPQENQFGVMFNGPKPKKIRFK